MVMFGMKYHLWVFEHILLSMPWLYDLDMRSLGDQTLVGLCSVEKKS